MESGVYIILNIVNGKGYIGKSVSLIHRLRCHRTDLRGGYHANNHLQNAWNKYGEDSFIFRILERCPVDLIGKRESYFIALYDSKNRAKGYNIDDATEEGGRIVSEETRNRLSLAKTGTFHSEETRKKMSASRKGRRLSLAARNKIANSMKGNSNGRGKVPSEEKRKRLSEANRGQKRSDEARRRMSDAKKKYLSRLLTEAPKL